MSLATFSTVVSAVVVATALTITSLALIRLSSRHQEKLLAPRTTALMWINATFLNLMPVGLHKHLIKGDFLEVDTLATQFSYLSFPSSREVGGLFEGNSGGGS